jgi:hypothetical protein
VPANHSDPCAIVLAKFVTKQKNARINLLAIRSSGVFDRADSQDAPGALLLIHETTKSNRASSDFSISSNDHRC